MNTLFGILGIACCAITIICYELNQKTRAEWKMDLIGVIGSLAMFAMPACFAIAIYV